MAEETVWTKLWTIIPIGSSIEVISEIHKLIPDSILFGSLLMYFLTQNMAFGVFGIFIFETVLSHKLISWIASQTVGPSRSNDLQCRAGYKTPQFTAQRMFSHDQYPSYAVFSITSIATYLGLSTKEFSSTLNAMGPEWQARSTVAYTFIGLMLSAFIGLRLWNCDTTTDVLIAFSLAIITGFILFHINKAIFGEEAMNFLGLPYMVSKESQGAPIYVCSAETEKE